MISVIPKSFVPDSWAGEPSARREIVESCALLAGLSGEAKELLVSVARFVRVDRGDRIWVAGTPSDFFVVLGSGVVKLCKATAKGKEITIEVFGPGECLGIIVALHGRPYPLCAAALTPCCFLKIPTEATKHVFAEATTAAKAMVESIAPRINHAHELLIKSTTATVEEKVAFVLGILGDKFGRTGKLGGIRLTYPFTRQEIAELAGTTVESCIRVMSRWEKAGLVTTENQVVTVRDPLKLRRIADGEETLS